MSLKENDAASGQHEGGAAAETTPTTSHGAIALGRIALSPSNPRTLHNRGKLLELLADRKQLHRIRELLADLTDDNRKELATVLGSEKFAEFVVSIHVHDVNQAVLLRPLPAARLADTQDSPFGERPDLELIAGERRYFASCFAGKPQIPSMVKAMTDQQVLEFQLVENLQREDLHPMEEAEGYERLCHDTGLGKEEIGAKVGKSRAYVYARLKLLDLCQRARQAFYEDKLDASRALLIARIPDEKLQLKALEEATRKDWSGAAPSVRSLQQWLRQNVMLHLSQAVFKITDASLVEAAGSCRECPKRTGAAPELFADVEHADICTDPKCFHKKEDAHRAQIVAAAQAKGLEVIDGKEAKALRPNNWSREISGYLDLDQPLPGDSKPLRKVLGKDAPQPAVFIDPHTHEAREIIPAEVARKVLKAKGVDKKVPKQQSEDRAAADAQRKKEELETRIEETWRLRAVKEIVGQVRDGKLQAFSGALLRLVVRDLLDTIFEANYGHDDRVDHLLELWNLPKDVEAMDALSRHVDAADELELGPMLISLVLAREIHYSAWNVDTKSTPAIAQVATEVGVDVDAIAAEVKAQIKAEVTEAKKAEKAKGAKKAKKAPAATPPAAHAEGESEGNQGAAVDAAIADAARTGTRFRERAMRNVKAKGTAAKKTSVEEATTGIADAMQNMDPASATGFQVGQRVRFKQDLKGAGGKLRKVSGREGTITTAIGDRAFSVRFGEKAHEVATADYTELEAVEAESAGQ